MERYLEILKEMVSTNSFTSNAEGVNQTGRLTVEAFTELGFKPSYQSSVNPAFGSHLVLTRIGTSTQKIGLITHLDTVFPPEEETANHFFWRVDGDKIYGPGTNDIKGGTVMVLMVMEGLEKFARDVFNQTTWIILANAAEERWSNDFGELCRRHLGEDALAALIFESGYVDNDRISLVTARKGMAVYDIHVEGKSAHAGNSHSSGANALVQIAEIIQKISRLTDYERDLTYNVGVLKGGTVPNRVPHLATAKGEMRCFSEQVFQDGTRKLLEINQNPALESADGTFSCKFAINVIIENPPWPRNANTDRLFSLWEETAASFEMNTVHEARGGLSDGNQLWDFLPTLDGLGPSGMNAHCSERSEDGSKDQEFVTISSFPIKAAINTLAIVKLISMESDQ
jgi:glutamate carboxypeptidase